MITTRRDVLPSKITTNDLQFSKMSSRNPLSSKMSTKDISSSKISTKEPLSSKISNKDLLSSKTSTKEPLSSKIIYKNPLLAKMSTIDLVSSKISTKILLPSKMSTKNILSVKISAEDLLFYNNATQHAESSEITNKNQFISKRIKNVLVSRESAIGLIAGRKTTGCTVVSTATRQLMVFVYLLFVIPALANIEPLPPSCSGIPQVDLLEHAVPSPKALPKGVNLLYDQSSHIHGYQFSPEADDIYLKADRILLRCIYFPYEFSVFITFKQYVIPKREECIFSLFHETAKDNLISVGFSKDRVVFRYKGRRYRFKLTQGYQDRKWHTLSLTMAAEVVTITRDCKEKRRRPLLTAFPDLLPVMNTSFSIGRCKQRSSVFQGLLKSIILVPGRDAAFQACQPAERIEQGFDNVIKTFPGRSSLTPFYSIPVICEWSDVGNIAFDVNSQKLKVCVNGIWKEVKIGSGKQRFDYLLPYQIVDTGQGSVLDVEVFELPGEGKFAAFASAGPNSSVKSRSSIYQWKDGKLVLYQTLPTLSAQSWEFFSIGNQFFLAVANYGLTEHFPSNSSIFKWNKVRKKFNKYQDLVTYTARDVESFEIDSNHYLAVANHELGGNNQIDSIIYKWSRKDRQFLEHQRLLTVGAYDWTYFMVDEYHFLAVANAFTGSTTLVFSVIYIWQDDSWIEFQTLETNGATDWEHFIINNDHYLAVANAYNFGSQNHLKIDSYKTNSTIYRLDREKKVFTKYQSISTYNAIDWEYLNIGDEHYLLVSNAQFEGTEDRLLSVMYRWQGVDKFVPIHHLHTMPNADFEVLKDGSNFYLIYANANKSNSEVLQFKFL